MQSITPRDSGWPRWVLWATLPVVLACGFVGGMALATYTAPRQVAVTGDPGQSQQPAQTPKTTQPASPPSTAPTVQAPSTDSSWRIPVLTTLPPATVTTATPEPQPTTSPQTPVGSPQTTNTEPVKVYAGAKVTTLPEAVAALTNEFGYYGRIRFTYQGMTNNSGGTSLVATISLSDYVAWRQALRDEPAKLKAWLESVAARVQPASSQAKFHIAWALYDRLITRPTDLPDSELFLQSDGSYLVIKPLASTLDHLHSTVSVRDSASLSQTSGGPVAQGTPWAAYGPRP